MGLIEDNRKIQLPGSVTESLCKVSERLSSFKTSDFVDRALSGPSVALLGRKSKLFRPTLVLMGAYVIDRNPHKFIDLAVSAELIHTASLIHDDIIDGDTERRGSFSVQAKYGSHMAILAGDALTSMAISISAKYGERMLKSMSQASMDMCAGEALDYYYQKRRLVPSLEDYARMASLKSASLIGACANAAAVCNSHKSSDAMYLAGKDLGMAFQIRDDIFDFINASNDRGVGKFIPNIVASLEKDYRIGRYSALMKAVQMNNDYVERAERRMAKSMPGKIFSSYAELIKVRL
ncbi:MAG: polyprenyl synthetase family protein [Candidatus Micrarchaeaceae archaeon]